MNNGIGVLGGGISGLAFADAVKGAEVLEKESEPGGLCRSVKEAGHTFDLGSHIVFSSNKAVLARMLELLGSNRITHRRNTKILYKGRMVKYPFENGLGDLPREEAEQCALDYEKAFHEQEQGPPRKARNFRDWMLYRFGKSITEKYLYPYNRKIWAMEPEMMDAFWVEGRVPQPPLQDVLNAAKGIPSEGYTHQLNFYYPKKGGYQALTDALARNLGARLKLNSEVVRVRKDGERWAVRTSDGAEREYGRLVSTIHLERLAAAMDMPADVRRAIGALRWNSIVLVMLGIRKEKLNDIHWLYLPDREVLPNRVSFPSNYSPYAAPKGHSSLLAEITFDPRGPLASRSAESIQSEVIAQMDSLGLMREGDVVFSKAIKLPYAYVVYDLDYLKNIRVVEDFARAEGITLLGRFSEFRYYNADKCMESAMEKAKIFP